MQKRTIVVLLVLAVLIFSALGIWLYSSDTSSNNQPNNVVAPPGANTPPIGGGCGVAQGNDPNSGNGIVRGPVL